MDLLKLGDAPRPNGPPRDTDEVPDEESNQGRSSIKTPDPLGLTFEQIRCIQREFQKLAQDYTFRLLRDDKEADRSAVLLSPVECISWISVFPEPYRQFIFGAPTLIAVAAATLMAWVLAEHRRSVRFKSLSQRIRDTFDFTLELRLGVPEESVFWLQVDYLLPKCDDPRCECRREARHRNQTKKNHQ